MLAELQKSKDDLLLQALKDAADTKAQEAAAIAQRYEEKLAALEKAAADAEAGRQAAIAESSSANAGARKALEEKHRVELAAMNAELQGALKAASVANEKALAARQAHDDKHAREIAALKAELKDAADTKAQEAAAIEKRYVAIQEKKDVEVVERHSAEIYRLSSQYEEQLKIALDKNMMFNRQLLQERNDQFLDQEKRTANEYEKRMIANQKIFETASLKSKEEMKLQLERLHEVEILKITKAFEAKLQVLSDQTKETEINSEKMSIIMNESRRDLVITRAIALWESSLRSWEWQTSSLQLAMLHWRLHVLKIKASVAMDKSREVFDSLVNSLNANSGLVSRNTGHSPRIYAKPKTPVVSSLNFSRISEPIVTHNDQANVIVSKETITSQQSASSSRETSQIIHRSEELEYGLFGEVVACKNDEKVEGGKDEGLFGEPGKAIASTTDALSPRSLRNSRRTRKKNRSRAKR
jgi:hypothetical protein